MSLGRIISSILFWVFDTLYPDGYDHIDSIIAGCALLFSSTIIGLFLLPNSLQHGYVGEMMIGVLLIQDFIAIVMLFMIDQ